MGMSVAEQQQLRALLLLSLSQGGDAGKLLSALVGRLWNPQENVWDDIKAEVEALIEQDLAKYDEQQVQNDLDGLKNVLADYQSALSDGLSDGGAAEINNKWDICNALFEEQLPNFQTPDYQLQLLLLFVQYANLYFALLRDGVMFGASWGKNADEVEGILTTLNTNIAAFQSYVTHTVGTAVSNVQAPTDKHAVEPFRTVNAYSRLLTFNALDVAALWPYFLPGTTAPNPPFMRYVYSDPVGTSDDSDNNVTVTAPPAFGLPISGVRVWADSGAVYAIQLQYGGTVLGPVQGYISSGTELPPYGGSFTVSPDNPIAAVLVPPGDHIQGLQFQFSDGGVSQGFGNGSGLAPLDNYGETVGDLNVASSSVFYNLSAACLIVGYMPSAS